jgi:hypothetical protein
MYIALLITIIMSKMMEIPQEYADCTELLIYIHLNATTQQSNRSGTNAYKNES